MPLSKIPRASQTDGPADPVPAPPRQRHEPLPWQTPKPAVEDPDAPRRVAAIMADPSYREAEQDVAFLARPESRGVRLQIEYQKPELILEQQGIEHTIVVFGSTRIRESAAAQRRVNTLLTEQQAAPDDPVLTRRLAVAKRILEKSRYYDIAREFGRLASQHDNRVTVMTGGGPGMMEAANRGAFDVGAKTVGLNITLPNEQYPNPYLTPGLCFSFHYFAMRKLHFLRRACALVVFPGGYGTFDELFDTLALIQTRKIQPVPVILVGEAWWRQAFNIDFLVDEGVIDFEDRELFWYAESAHEIWNGILNWHEANGTPLPSPAIQPAKPY